MLIKGVTKEVCMAEKATVKQIVPKCSEKITQRKFFPETGTRFPPKSAKQLAFDILIKGAKEGKKIEDIKREMIMVRREHGYKFDLDQAYPVYCIACHPEFFKYYSDGSIKVIRMPKIDNEARAVKRMTDVKEMKKNRTKVLTLRRQGMK
jgi:hypothetical protein